MKIALMADLHLRGCDLPQTRAQLMASVDVMVERGVQVVGVAGDIAHRMNLYDTSASTGAVARVALEWARALQAHGIEALMIPGNHDYSGPGRADALHVFDACPNVRVARRAESLAWNGLRILAVPWLYTDRDFNAVVSDLRAQFGDNYTWHLLLAHVQVFGALQNRRHAMEFEQPLQTYVCRPGDWSTSADFLSNLPVMHIALGDFHFRQDVVEDRGGFVGALRQLDFGEEGNPQGFEIWDSETDTTEWIELDECPVHRTIIAKPGEPVQMLDPEGCRYRVRYDGMPDPLEARELEARGVQVEAIVEKRERVKRCEVPSGMVGDLPATLRFWAGQQTDEVDVDRALDALRLIDSDDVEPVEDCPDQQFADAMARPPDVALEVDALARMEQSGSAPAPFDLVAEVNRMGNAMIGQPAQATGADDEALPF